MKYLRISWELLVTSMVFTYPTWTIIIPTSWIQSENVDIKMQVCDRHANEHTALKRLGGDFTDRKKGWRCSLDRISKVYRYRHQKTKLKIKFHLYIGDSCHQNIKKYVTWGLKSQKFYVFFPCNPRLWSHSLVVCALKASMFFLNICENISCNQNHAKFWLYLFKNVHNVYDLSVSLQCFEFTRIQITDQNQNSLCDPSPKVFHLL